MGKNYVVKKMVYTKPIWKANNKNDSFLASHIALIISPANIITSDVITVMLHECHGVLNHWLFFCSTVCSTPQQRKHQSFTLLALCEGNAPVTIGFLSHRIRGCFTNVLRALQDNLAKRHNARNHICNVNSKLELCTCAQSHALCTRTKFQLEILIRSTISAIHSFRKNIWELAKR